MTHEQVLQAFEANVEVVRALLLGVIAALASAEADCLCRHALDGLKLPFDLP